jgi:hypothetical protein
MRSGANRSFNIRHARPINAATTSRSAAKTFETLPFSERRERTRHSRMSQTSQQTPMTMIVCKVGQVSRMMWLKRRLFVLSCDHISSYLYLIKSNPEWREYSEGKIRCLFRFIIRTRPIQPPPVNPRSLFLF